MGCGDSRWACDPSLTNQRVRLPRHSCWSGGGLRGRITATPVRVWGVEKRELSFWIWGGMLSTWCPPIGKSMPETECSRGKQSPETDQREDQRAGEEQAQRMWFKPLHAARPETRGRPAGPAAVIGLTLSSQVKPV